MSVPTITTVLAATAALVALTAAARSTWSPCGTSMLSTVTPLAERGRGHRYRTTVAWFVAGSVTGGATLGLAMAALAAVTRALGPAATPLALLGACGGLVAAASDAELAGFHLPVHHRQVNERWLDQFRPWVYGAGFGWQIGVGLATYIKTSAVYLTIALAALTGRPWVAWSIGMLFGLVRGLAVFLGRRITTPEALARFHRRFDELGPVALAVVVGSEVVAAGACAWLVSPWATVAVAVATVSVVLALWRRRWSRASSSNGAVPALPGATRP